MLPRVLSARGEVHLFFDASPALLGLAVVLEAASLLAYTSLTRVILPIQVRTRFMDQLRIDLTGLGVSHVVPGGGATAGALRYRLMTKWGVPGADAASTAAVQVSVAAIGLVGTFVSGVILMGVGIASHPGFAAAGIVALFALIVVGFGLYRMGVAAKVRVIRPLTRLGLRSGRSAGFWDSRLGRLGRRGAQTFRATSQRSGALMLDPEVRVTVFAWAASNWLLDAASLWVCLRCYGLSLDPGALLAAYGAANLIGLLPITPGGLGIVEGVLIPSLVALGAAPLGPAALGVLTWRLLEFWIPIPVSGIAYLSLRVQPPRRPPATF